MSNKQEVSVTEHQHDRQAMMIRAFISPAELRQLRVEAARSATTMQEIVGGLITEWLEQKREEAGA